MMLTHLGVGNVPLLWRRCGGGRARAEGLTRGPVGSPVVSEHFVEEDKSSADSI